MLDLRTLNRMLVLSAVAACGCDSSTGPIAPAQAAESSLRDVGELCRVYQLVHKAPPKTIKDLERGGSQATPAAFSAIRSGAIVLRYGATLPNTAEEPGAEGSDQVLAYFKKVPTEGGLVLMLDRNLRTMTADEFKTAKLAGK